MQTTTHYYKYLEMTESGECDLQCVIADCAQKIGGRVLTESGIMSCVFGGEVRDDR